MSDLDFTTPIHINDVPDGGMLAGRIGDEAAVLIRRGDEVFAVGGTCTHYGGPLADGIVTGDTLRCPWHHACFDIRTGEATRAPALNALVSWHVERRGEFVVAGAKREPLAPKPVETRVESVGVIGGGAAGAAAVEMLRRRGFQGSITMISAEETLPVDRPNLSKDYLAGNAPEEWIPLRTPEFYSEQNIEAITGHRVMLLDSATKKVTLDNGEVRAFDAILIATGAEPIRLTPPGAERVHLLRTLRDSRAIIAEAEKGKRVVVLGASFIGLEVAASLRARECDVTVVAPEEIPLAKPMGKDVGAFIRRLHEQHGVVFRLGTTVSKFEANRVVLSNGETLPADFIVAGVGVRPNTMLAQLARLRVENGVVVDEFLETNSPGIFAAGDVASYPDPFSGHRLRVEHWAAAEAQGQTAACNILGMRQAHTAPPFFWSAHYDVTIAFVGNSMGFDTAEVRGSLDDRRALVVYRKEGTVLAVAAIGLDQEALWIEVAMEKVDRGAIERVINSV